MKITASNLNKFVFFKLPSAFICGVRVKHLDNTSCIVTVKHRWINQNPFHSMYWAVQGMAAELASGALVMQQIQKSGIKVSMLVANNKSNFSKKATGRISFSCSEGNLVEKAMQEAITSGEGQSFWMKSIGTNENGEVVSQMDFEWTIKVK
ncbi:MAG: DUF4442 domain-containing protein [Flavobacterium sp.]|nr:DUF4442 domain-containing protein [Flavobacterium sp.]